MLPYLGQDQISVEVAEQFWYPNLSQPIMIKQRDAWLNIRKLENC